MMKDGEDKIVARRLKQELGKGARS
jgi:hypothetical protein